MGMNDQLKEKNSLFNKLLFRLDLMPTVALEVSSAEVQTEGAFGSLSVHSNSIKQPSLCLAIKNNMSISKM